MNCYHLLVDIFVIFIIEPIWKFWKKKPFDYKA
jgi:hypothetical protein